MPDLVHRLLFAPTGIESIRKVQNESVAGSNVSVSVHHTRRNKSRDRIVLTYQKGISAERFPRTIFPKDQLEFSGKKCKAVGLIFVFMRTSRDPCMGNAEITHGHPKTFRNFVFSKDLCQPSSVVGILLEGKDG